MGGSSSKKEPKKSNLNINALKLPAPRPSTTYNLSPSSSKEEPNKLFLNINAPNLRLPGTPTIFNNSGVPSLQPPPIPTRQPSNDDYDPVDVTTRILESIRITRQSLRHIEDPTRSLRNPQLFDLYTTQIVTYTPLEPYDSEYLKINAMITNKRNFKVDSIEKIENPYLEKAFELKQLQKETEFESVQERLLFHGTKKVHVDTICTMNFDWRKCQAHKYGRGVSFSPNSTYASVYSDKGVYNKVMIVAKVLIGKSCIGNQFMEVPHDGYDTSQKDEGIVIVKFEDNEFCPAYKINYHVVDENVGRGRGNRRRGGMVRQNFAPSVLSYDDFDFLFRN